MGFEDFGIGAGAFGEGAKSTLLPTLNYKIALAQQQFQAGLQTQKLAMEKERQAIDMQTQNLNSRVVQQKLEEANAEEQAVRDFIGKEPALKKFGKDAKSGMDVTKSVDQIKKHRAKAFLARSGEFDRLLGPTEDQIVDRDYKKALTDESRARALQPKQAGTEFERAVEKNSWLFLRICAMNEFLKMESSTVP